MEEKEQLIRNNLNTQVRCLSIDKEHIQKILQVLKERCCSACDLELANLKQFEQSDEDFANFKDGNELKVLRRIDRSHFPLIRFWRWPEGYRSALAITGEIDGITAGDFIKNVLH